MIREDLWTGRNIGGRDIVRGKLEALAELGQDGQISVEASALTATGKMFAETGDADVNGFDNLYTRLRFDYDLLMVQAVYDLNIGNPDLRNQTIDSLETGYVGSFFDGKLLVRLDLAYNWYRWFIWFRFSPDELEYIYIGGVSYPDITGPGIGFANEKEEINGHNLDVDICFRPTNNSRLFLTAGYRQIIYAKSKLFSRNNPVLHMALGGDLRGQSGWTVSIRAFYTSKHRRGQRDPDSILEPDIGMWLEPTLLLNARLARKIEAGPVELTVGLEGFNIIGSRFREAGGLSMPNRPDLGAELVDRRICLFLQGKI